MTRVSKYTHGFEGIDYNRGAKVGVLVKEDQVESLRVAYGRKGAAQARRWAQGGGFTRRATMAQASAFPATVCTYASFCS